MKKTKGTIVFRAVYFSLTGLAVIAIAIGLVIFNNFLADFENTLPEKQADKFISNMDGESSELIIGSTNFITNEFERTDAFKNYYQQFLMGNYSYVKASKDSTEENPVYKIKSGDNEVARITLRQTGEMSQFGFPLYELDNVRCNEPETLSVTVTAPSNATVYVNGLIVGSSYITKSGEPEKHLEYFLGYIDEEDKPFTVTYTIEGFLLEPEISVKDADGNEIAADEKGEYTVGGVKEDTVSAIALDASTTYSKFIFNDSDKQSVIDCLSADSPMIEAITDYQQVYDTWHSNYEIKNQTISDTYFYGDDCAYVSVSYDYIIYADGEETAYPTTNSVYLIMKDGEWRVLQIVMN